MTTYYIGTNGSDSHSTTQAQVSETPWATFAHAIGQMTNGDVLKVLDGTYNQQIVADVAGITIQGNTALGALINGKNKTYYSVLVTAANVTLDGLKIDYNPAHTKPGQRNNRVDVRGDNCLIQNCLIRHTDRPWSCATFDVAPDAGIRLNGVDGCEISNNEITRSCHGIQVRAGSTDWHIHDNHIHTVVNQAIDINGSCSDGLIEDNLMENSLGEDCIQFNADYALVERCSEATEQRVIIRNNIIRNFAENAIDLKGAGNIVIEGNIIHNIRGNHGGGCEADGDNRRALKAISHGNYKVNGVQCSSKAEYIIIRNNIIYDGPGGIDQLGVGTKIYNNTIIYCNRDYAGTNQDGATSGKTDFSGWKLAEKLGDADVSFVNNIVGGMSSSIIAIGKTPSGGSSDIDYNVYFTPSGKSDKFVWLEGGNYNYLSFAAIKAKMQGDARISGEDANSTHVASLAGVYFTDVDDNPSAIHTNYDFSVGASSPAYQAGRALTTLTQAASASTTLRVEDAGFFCDGFGVATGDTITCGGMTTTITDVTGNTITVADAVTASSGAGVYFGSSSAPNIGILSTTAAVIQAAFSLDASGTNDAPLTVNFTDESQAGDGETLSAWSWEYSRNEGAWTQFSTSQNPSYEFTAAGDYRIRLTVTDTGAASDSTRLAAFTLESVVIAPATSAFRAWMVTAASGTSSGSVDLTHASVTDVPEAALFFMGRGSSYVADDAGSNISIGMATDMGSAVATYYAQDNVGTQDTGGMYRQNAVGYIQDPTDASEELLVVLSEFTAGGCTVTCTNTAGTSYPIYAIFFANTNGAKLATPLPPSSEYGTTTVSGLGTAATLAFAIMSRLGLSATDYSRGALSFGVAHWDGATMTQAGLGYSANDGASPSYHREWISNDNMLVYPVFAPSDTDYTLQASSNSDGLTYTRLGGSSSPNNSEISTLMLSLDDASGVKILFGDTSTTDYNCGFTPGTILAFATGATAFDTRQNGAQMAVGVWHASDEYSVAVAGDSLQATSDTRTWLREALLEMADDDGTTGISVSVASTSETGFTISASSDIGVVKLVFVAFAEPAGGGNYDPIQTGLRRGLRAGAL
ncbi:MAG: right-handed parallel beta-helix repeat-containing protein [Caldilineaceae bacterium]|nr:right-handed parallel beta-helix repeat-containing protein [Caldilineaceae bacterium]